MEKQISLGRAHVRGIPCHDEECCKVCCSQVFESSAIDVCSEGCTLDPSEVKSACLDEIGEKRDQCLTGFGFQRGYSVHQMARCFEDGKVMQLSHKQILDHSHHRNLLAASNPAEASLAIFGGIVALVGVLSFLVFAICPEKMASEAPKGYKATVRYGEGSQRAGHNRIVAIGNQSSGSGPMLRTTPTEKSPPKPLATVTPLKQKSTPDAKDDVLESLEKPPSQETLNRLKTRLGTEVLKKPVAPREGLDEERVSIFRPSSEYLKTKNEQKELADNEGFLSPSPQYKSAQMAQAQHQNKQKQKAKVQELELPTQNNNKKPKSEVEVEEIDMSALTPTPSEPMPRPVVNIVTDFIPPPPPDDDEDSILGPAKSNVQSEVKSSTQKTEEFDYSNIPPPPLPLDDDEI